MKDKISVKMRLSNNIFKCVICSTWKNIKTTECYVVNAVRGVGSLQNGQMAIATDTVTVCADCWEKSDIKFEEPPEIITPDSRIISIDKN